MTACEGLRNTDCSTTVYVPPKSVLMDDMPQYKDACQVNIGRCRSQKYNCFMATGTIEKLLETANSASESDTSLNLAKRRFLEEQAAAKFFESTRIKLFRIGEWKKNSSVTDYDLFNENGDEINGEPVSVGTFVRIALYGSGKYDWVRVISVSDESDEVVISVKPSYDPTQRPADVNTVSHFFGPEASNNFCLQRDEKTVAFYVIGLNEHQNTKFTDGLIESARNAAVANVGYYSGLQKSVWKEFCSSFLSTDEEKDS